MPVSTRSLAAPFLLGGLAASLIGCSSPLRIPSLPIFEARPAARPAPAASTAATGRGASAPASAPLGGVAAASMTPVIVAPVPVPPPVPAAVAARFPEPAVSFETPAFAAGRQTFTRNDELRALFYGLARDGAIGERNSDVRVVTLGLSQGGQPIEALALTRPPSAPANGASTALPIRRPTVAIVAGQHGDEPAGSEAVAVIAQELAGGRLSAVLDRVDVVLVARANPDGADAFSRTASDGTDINRDHLLLRSAEARALTRLAVEFAPVVVLDLHEYPVGGAFTAKFGAVQRFDALIQYATTPNLAPFVTKAAEEWFRMPMIASLRGAGMSVDWYATTSSDVADRTLTMGSIGAQVGRNASGLRNAVSLLVETRGGGLGRVDLKRRVQAQVVATQSVLASASVHAADLEKLRQFVDRETVSLACRGQIVIDAAPTPSEYAYSMIDAASGEIRNLTVSWQSALLLRPLRTRPRPCGYWLAPGETEAVLRLRLLGIEVQQLDELAELRGETFRETGRTTANATPESAAANAGAATHLRVQLVPALLDVAAGGYYVSLAQPLAHLAVAALEPESPASFAANGVIASVAGQARVLQKPDARMTPVP